jgi:hypothetical protein
VTLVLSAGQADDSPRLVPLLDAQAVQAAQHLEGGFGRFRQWRGIATRTCLGGVLRAAAVILTRP